jgi:WD40 repeat protein
LVFGTTAGRVCAVPSWPAASEAALAGRARRAVDTESGEAVLGLCWLREGQKVLVGLERGGVRLYDVGRGALLQEFERFAELTCVHANDSQRLVLASGYQPALRLYDLPTGRSLATLRGLHSAHINVAKFAHHAPDLFATSSFDREVKLWDLRCLRSRRPVFARRCNAGCVMVCWSPDDRFLLSSSVDNEVRQWLAADGRQHLHLDVKRTLARHNYTRAYYMLGAPSPQDPARYIVLGSCEEHPVRVFCAQTGRHLKDVPLLYPNQPPGNFCKPPPLHSPTPTLPYTYTPLHLNSPAPVH